ncbi:MAG: rod shape-determining protein [Christensenellales bacterium]
MALHLFSKDLGIDLGTANTLVFCKGRGIVINEPSVVAVKNVGNNRREVLAVGLQAQKMIGRTPGNIMAIRPLKDGVIADFEITELMLKYFIKKAIEGSFWFGFAPRVVICVPFGVTEVERRAVEEAARSAGAREAYLLDEPMAAAIGAGLPIGEATGSMIVDIGGGTSEVAVLSLGGIVTACSLRVGGNHMDDAIVNYVKREYNLMIGERTAEEVKINIGTADGESETKTMAVRGRDILTGLPNTVEISSTEIKDALYEPISAIVEAVKNALETTPPELAADLVERGIVLTGGAASLKGLDKFIMRETGLPVTVAQNPFECVVFGAAAVAEDMDVLKRGLMNFSHVS